MTNEEKARVLSNKGCLGAYISRDAEALYPTEEDKKRLSIYGACMEAMEWKDKEHAKEKQQWIEKVGEWINDNYFEYLQPISYHEQLQNSIDINDFVNDLKKAMEE